MHGDKTSKTKKTILDLQTISVSDLPELQGWKEKMEATVKENPFVAIKDHETYQGAKKARTALKSARTEVQNQEKLIASKLRSFRSKVGEESQKLVDITLKHEEKQQAEVKKYEDAKAEEKRIKEEAEKIRVQNIKNALDKAEQDLLSIVRGMDFSSIIKATEAFNTNKESTETFDFEEFSPMYDELVSKIEVVFNERIKELEVQEEVRLENERLRAENEKIRERNEILRPYIVFIRDYDAVMNLDDDAFVKEIVSLKNQMLEYQKHEQEKAEQQRKAEELASEERKKREEAEEKLRKMEWEKEQQKIEGRTKERISQLVNDLQLKPDHTGENYGNELVFIELEEIETLSVDDWNVFFEEKRVFISENNKPVEEPDEIEEVDFERNLPSFLIEDELGFVRTSRNVGVDVTDEWDTWLNENGIEL